MDNQDRKKEYDAFIEDIKFEVNSMMKQSDNYVSTWNDLTKRREGQLGHFGLDTFDMFNHKYRHLFDKNTRDLIGKLNMGIDTFNAHVRILHDTEASIIFKNESRDKEMKAMIGKYNAELNRIKEYTTDLNQLLNNYKKPNWFKRMRDRSTSVDTRS